MAVEAKITLNKQQYVQELEQVKNKTKQATGNIQESARKTGEDFSRVGGAASAMGSVVGQQFGAIGQAISALAAGPIGILLAAITAVITAATWLWDKLTVSAEEYKSALSTQAEALQQQQKIVDDQEKQAGKYLKRLDALSKIEDQSNSEKREAKKLVDMLSQSYGDFGIRIDETTGKITGLDAAQKEMAKRSLQRRLELLKSEQKIQQGVLDFAIKEYSEDVLMGSDEKDLQQKWGTMTSEQLQEEMGRQMSYEYNQRDEDRMAMLKNIADANAKRIELQQRLEELNLDLLALENERKPEEQSEKIKENAEIKAENAESAMAFTNSLTQRGGFATGAKVESLNDINRRIADASTRSSKALQEINAKMDNLDKVRL